MGGKALWHLVQFFHDYFPEGWDIRYARASEAVEAFVHGERPGAVRLVLADLQHLLAADVDEAGLRRVLRLLDCRYRPWLDGLSARAWLVCLCDRFHAVLYGSPYDVGHV